jgi:hypothetical protein
MPKPLGTSIAIALMIVLVSPTRAYAYIDPVAGSVILQAVAAAFLAGAYTLRRSWSQVRTVVGGLIRRVARR